MDLKLWRSRWHERFLDYAAGLTGDGVRRMAALALVGLSRALYVFAQYVRFWAAILTYPVQIFRRWRIYYSSLWTRLRGRAFLPTLLR